MSPFSMAKEAGEASIFHPPGEADMIPGAKLSYDLEINDRNGKTKAPGSMATSGDSRGTIMANYGLMEMLFFPEDHECLNGGTKIEANGNFPVAICCRERRSLVTMVVHAILPSG